MCRHIIWLVIIFDRPMFTSSARNLVAVEILIYTMTSLDGWYLWIADLYLSSFEYLFRETRGKRCLPNSPSQYIQCINVNDDFGYIGFKHSFGIIFEEPQTTSSQNPEEEVNRSWYVVSPVFTEKETKLKGENIFLCRWNYLVSNKGA